MCYSRDSFCSCCYNFIRVLTKNYCYRTSATSSICCPFKWVFPKTFEKCKSCQSCKSYCSLIKKGPRKWKQPTHDYISEITFSLGNNRFGINYKTESKLQQVDQSLNKSYKIVATKQWVIYKSVSFIYQDWERQYFQTLSKLFARAQLIDIKR